MSRGKFTAPRVRLCPKCGHELTQLQGCVWECENPGCEVIQVKYRQYSLDLHSVHMAAKVRERYL